MSLLRVSMGGTTVQYDVTIEHHDRVPYVWRLPHVSNASAFGALTNITPRDHRDDVGLPSSKIARSFIRILRSLEARRRCSLLIHVGSAA